MRNIFLSVSLLLAVHAAQANDKSQADQSEYAGQEARTIRSLSSGDIAELRRGGGWGLAKAAELNGVPGPAHLLELKDKIPLDENQVATIRELYVDMKAQAIVQGEILIALEQELEQHFKAGTVTNETLRSSLEAISTARGELRFIHLAAHLKSPAILTAEQINRYNRLRGYDLADPCAVVPAGHNAEMWRKHNGCRKQN